MVPHLRVRDLSKLDFASMRAAGIVGLVLDKDNTLTAPYAMEVEPRLRRAVEQARQTFGSQNVVVLSNSAGTPDDVGDSAAAAMEAALSLPVMRRREKKPRGFEGIRAHFGGCSPAKLVMVGDRYLTDVTFGNAHGMLTVHTQMLTPHGDPFVVKCARRAEAWLARRFTVRGIQPPLHELVSHVASFTKPCSEDDSDGGSEMY
uniref:Phosphatidylglycerophosphatase n=1 Tax=Coccolithus braarudii TaxID=221442 RepID=A0A7S0L2L9_9EUKA